MDTGKATWEKAAKVVTEEKSLRIVLNDPTDARRFLNALRVARARNAREMKQLYPELPPTQVRSEWDRLDVRADGSTVIIEMAKMPKIEVVEAT